ncbi:hypothetical protein DBR23_05790 [Acidovorax sp. HMWF018]|nr:hypothetical protein DBR23_05790 [Acidovorax sp. HMWF018]
MRCTAFHYLQHTAKRLLEQKFGIQGNIGLGLNTQAMFDQSSDHILHAKYRFPNWVSNLTFVMRHDVP